MQLALLISFAKGKPYKKQQKHMSSVIIGTGAYIPEDILKNEHFSEYTFYETTGKPHPESVGVTIDKFRKITGISERRYAPKAINTSDMAAEAGRKALEDSKIDPETLDQIVVSHNFGDVSHGSIQSQNVPSVACRVKHLLNIQNPACIAYDVLVGCPGWVHSVIQAHAYFQAGMSKRVLLIGAETLSRVIDLSDRDSMIFADGAGAVVMEHRETSADGSGILGCCALTHSVDELDYIDMGISNKYSDSNAMFIKMKGRKVYEYALKHVPQAMKDCVEKSGLQIKDINKILIHQANEKMDEEIVKRLYALYNTAPPENIMPMSIHWLGNSSVATVPTLYHLVSKNMIPEHQLSTGDIVLFASVGAGMNINAVCYRV
ncbi:3-oxoacyl-ACP synthase III family protein [Chitinophaga sp. GCM10012297]|uniref:Ketoacyl-ACP synthase III n=1 Tax=Chitinophaga chungangae TaxID=2821488 RepID=A0ABS3YHG3_9BACT|nr:ketoacyl-ACP synthase III [Chitinophaga chungangae]MBO9154121.1 ketoacyl-ACP synthase III [Chitinophaga chungangae]